MRRAADQLGVQIRVGVHTGEVELIAGDVRGVAVHEAARLLSIGGAGEVVVSETTHRLLEGSGLAFEDAGLHEFKGLTGRRRVFKVARPAE
jgi:class 3 adenylate cyclase